MILRGLKLIAAMINFIARIRRGKHNPSDVVRITTAKTFAHRGVTGHTPENTMAAFEKSVEAGYDYIELDVRMSKDGRVVVIHDKRVDRTTNGSGRVDRLTGQELKQMDAGARFAPAFAGEGIPFLEEVLDRFRGKIRFLIDLKRPCLYPGIEHELARVLKARGLDKASGEVIVQSFDFRSLQIFHRILPKAPVGILIRTKLQLTQRKLQHFSTFANYINANHRLVTLESADRIHEHNMGVMVWTVKNPESVSSLLSIGVDGLVTKHPLLVASDSEGVHS